MIVERKMPAQLQLLVEQPSAIENDNDDDALSESACPDCDCLLEQFYDESGNSKYLCDNCGIFVSGSAIRQADMDITK